MPHCNHYSNQLYTMAWCKVKTECHVLNTLVFKNYIMYWTDKLFYLCSWKEILKRSNFPIGEHLCRNMESSLEFEFNLCSKGQTTLFAHSMWRNIPTFSLAWLNITLWFVIWNYLRNSVMPLTLQGQLA